MERLEQMTQRFAVARRILAERIGDLEDGIRRLKREQMEGIKAAVAEAKAARADLEAAVREQPDQFDKPKTRIFHGIRIGYRRTKSKAVAPDGPRVVQLIREKLPEMAEALIQRTEKPVMAALVKLNERQLARIGVYIEPGREEVVVQGTDTEVEKLVNGLLKDPEFEEAS